jgi:hypothetical protein
LKFINAKNLEVLNQGKDSTFCEHQRAEVSQSVLDLQDGLWCGVGLLAVRLHHSTIHHLCISTLVVRLSKGWCQEKTKQSTQTYMFRDKGNCARYSCGCYGGTHLISSTRFSGKGRGKISSTSTLESGILVLPSPQSRTK